MDSSACVESQHFEPQLNIKAWVHNCCQVTLQCFKKCIWVKVFKNGPNKICERQPLKNLKGYGLLTSAKAVFHRFYLVLS